MTIDRYTEKEYWDSKYNPGEKEPLEVHGYKNIINAGVYRYILQAGLDGKSVLEIGAGDSQWLPYLAIEHSSSEFTGLDYSEHGCKELEVRAAQQNASISVVCADLFNPPQELVGQFDLIYSLGVVEHFDDLSSVIKAFKPYLKPGGKIISEIPNLSGFNGKLAKWFDRSIYDIHNPHNLKSLGQGHEDAGLSIESLSMVGSNEFGVLSSCMGDHSTSLQKNVYLWLTRLTKLLAIFEYRVIPLPKTGYFTPLLMCTAVLPG